MREHCTKSSGDINFWEDKGDEIKYGINSKIRFQLANHIWFNMYEDPTIFEL